MMRVAVEGGGGFISGGWIHAEETGQNTLCIVANGGWTSPVHAEFTLPVSEGICGV